MSKDQNDLLQVPVSIVLAPGIMLDLNKVKLTFLSTHKYDSLSFTPNGCQEIGILQVPREKN
jgi:hypothetical protein